MFKIDVVNTIKRIIMLTPFQVTLGHAYLSKLGCKFQTKQPKGYANSNLDYLKETSIKVSKHRLSTLLGFNKRTTLTTE
jgi:hypothetical protein